MPIFCIPKLSFCICVIEILFSAFSNFISLRNRSIISLLIKCHIPMIHININLGGINIKVFNPIRNSKQQLIRVIIIEDLLTLPQKILYIIDLRDFLVYYW